MKISIAVGWTGLFVLLAGCATSYRGPQVAPGPVTVSVSGSRLDVFDKAVAAVLSEGFVVASADRGLGFISTQRRQMVLTPRDADVGSTMGIDYLKDKRTTCHVAVSIQVSDGQAVIRTDIDAEYLPNDAAFGKRMKGVSRGTIEEKIASRLR